MLNAPLMMIPMADIHIDQEWNCRGFIDEESIKELAESIRINGLQSPITLQRSDDVPNKRYKIVAGHRRFLAVQSLGLTQIQAFVHEKLTSVEARDLNVIENLQRADLTLGQEANAIRDYVQLGYDNETIGSRLSKSPSWVAVRRKILDLPLEVQQLANNDVITAADVNLLHRARFKGDRFAQMIGALRDKRYDQQEIKLSSLLPNTEKKTTKKRRNTLQIRAVQSVIRELNSEIDPELTVTAGSLMTIEGNSVVTRILGWVNGDVDTGALEESLNEYYNVFYVRIDNLEERI